MFSIIFAIFNEGKGDLAWLDTYILVVRGAKNRRVKDMYLEEIGLCAEILLNILVSISNIITGEAYAIIQEERDSSFW